MSKSCKRAALSLKIGRGIEKSKWSVQGTGQLLGLWAWEEGMALDVAVQLVRKINACPYSSFGGIEIILSINIVHTTLSWSV
jgi:hypothetical protein